MMAKLNGRPLNNSDGDLDITFRKPPISVKEFTNDAFSKHPVIIVLRQVTPKSATFTQGNFCGGACSNNISTGGLKELSMRSNCRRGLFLNAARDGGCVLPRIPLLPLKARGHRLMRCAIAVPLGLPRLRRLQRLQVLARLKP